MQKFIRCFILSVSAVALGAAVYFPSVASAAPAGSALVVIRFNQAHVHYDQQLYSAISQAASIKPDVIFHVVSFAPATGDTSADEQWVATASRNTQAVVATLRSIGVPPERLRITGESTPSLRFDETRIYAQ